MPKSFWGDIYPKVALLGIWVLVTKFLVMKWFSSLEVLYWWRTTILSLKMDYLWRKLTSSPISPLKNLFETIFISTQNKIKKIIGDKNVSSQETRAFCHEIICHHAIWSVKVSIDRSYFIKKKYSTKSFVTICIGLLWQNYFVTPSD